MGIMYILLILAVVFASVNSVVLHKIGAIEKNTIYNLNLITALCWCIVLFLVNGGKLTINSQVLMWGAIYGVVQSMFVLFKASAMCTGPVAITTLIGNSSLIISIIVSLIVWHERISLEQIIGVVILCVGIFLCTYKKSDDKYNSKWKYLVILFLIFAAGVGITFKAFSKSGNSNIAGDMMVVSAVVMVLAFSVMSLLTGGIKICKTELVSKNMFLIYAVLSGLLSCMYNRLNIFTSGRIDAVIFFPGFNGGVILLSTVLSVLICKEKLNKKQVVGIIMGTAAICGIGIL